MQSVQYNDFLEETRDKVADWICNDKTKALFAANMQTMQNAWQEYIDAWGPYEKEIDAHHEASKGRAESQKRAQWEEEYFEYRQKEKEFEAYHQQKEWIKRTNKDKGESEDLGPEPEAPRHPGPPPTGDFKPEMPISPLAKFCWPVRPNSLDIDDYRVLLGALHDGFNWEERERSRYICSDLRKDGSVVGVLYWEVICNDSRSQSRIKEALGQVERDLKDRGLLTTEGQLAEASAGCGDRDKRVEAAEMSRPSLSDLSPKLKEVTAALERLRNLSQSAPHTNDWREMLNFTCGKVNDFLNTVSLRITEATDVASHIPHILAVLTQQHLNGLSHSIREIPHVPKKQILEREAKGEDVGESTIQRCEGRSRSIEAIVHAHIPDLEDLIGQIDKLTQSSVAEKAAETDTDRLDPSGTKTPSRAVEEGDKPGKKEKSRPKKKKVGLKDRFTFNPGQVIFDGKDLELPTGFVIDSVLKKLHDSFGSTVPYAELDDGISKNVAEEPLRKAVRIIRKVLREKEAPVEVQTKTREGYCLCEVAQPKKSPKGKKPRSIRARKIPHK